MLYLPKSRMFTRFVFLFSIVAISLLACNKPDAVTAIGSGGGSGGGTGGGGGGSLPPALPDLTTTILSTVSGFVTDENDAAVSNVTVQAGTAVASTDKYGYFTIANATVVQNAAVVTVTKTGYFKSIKTYVAIAGKPVFFRIKMIPKTNAGFINAATGGSAGLSNGLSISLPANAVVNAATNIAYAGTVNVAAKWIDPTAADLERVMPGDLRGLNTDGYLQLLASYGMCAVELTGTGGELLQIAAGKKASLSVPVPAALSSTAGASIPLWYFDEVKGLWKQEGTAAKSGNVYVGEVSHFSFWNCDVPNSFVQFSCTILGGNGQPIQNARVKISAAATPWYASYGYTNADGFVSGPVPDRSQLVMEVFSNTACGTAAYAQSFTTTTQTVSLGTVNINSGTTVATISGNVINCNNTAVTNGYVIVQNGILLERYPLTNTGTFSFTQLICGGVTNRITLVGEDIATAQQSIAANYTVTSGNNTIPPITACVVREQYLDFTINGSNYSYSTPADLFQPQAVGGGSSFYWYFVNNIIELSFTRAGIAQGSTQSLFKFTCPQIPYTPTFVTVAPITVNITECGPVDSYISGNFTGVIIGPSNSLYNITCTFRVKRAY